MLTVFVFKCCLLSNFLSKVTTTFLVKLLFSLKNNNNLTYLLSYIAKLSSHHKFITFLTKYMWKAIIDPIAFDLSPIT